MFFFMSALSDERVTQRTVYPAFSKDADAVAIAVHVFPVPVEW